MGDKTICLFDPGTAQIKLVVDNLSKEDAFQLIQQTHRSFYLANVEWSADSGETVLRFMPDWRLPLGAPSISSPSPALSRSS